MRLTFNATFVSLHVRRTNRAALSLYQNCLRFERICVHLKYCELHFAGGGARSRLVADKSSQMRTER